MDISAVSNIQSIQDMYTRDQESRANMLQKALNLSYNMLPIDKFMDIAGITLSDTLPFKLMWNSFQHNIPIYMSDSLIKVFGYNGTLFHQKNSLMRLVEKYKDIKIVQLSNEQYEEFTHRNPEMQNEEMNQILDGAYPPITKAQLKSRPKHVLMMPDDFKKLLLVVRTDNGDRAREYVVQLDKLFNLYWEYQTLYKSRELTIKDSRIDDLISEVKSQSVLIREQNQGIVERNQTIGDMKDMMVEMKEEIGMTRDVLDDVNKKLDISSDERAVRTKSSQTHDCFVIIKLNNPSSRWEYYAVRTQRRSMNQRLKELRVSYPKYTELLTIQYQPNSVNFLNLMREELSQITIKGTKIRLHEGYSEYKFVHDVKDLDLSKKDVGDDSDNDE
jgi:hypothetical protein